tara:strand:- start:334 stop:951 length:618 start_codon:yes stop_codon:yes gene_type:complete
MGSSLSTAATPVARPGLWAGLFCANFAIIAVLFTNESLNPPTSGILFVLNFVLLIPFVKGVMRIQEEKGAMTTAVRRYNRRFLTFSLIYAVAMLGAGWATGLVAQDAPLMWLLAVLPMVPAFGMIWTIMRYVAEETDEYQRHRAITAAMTGLALVLVCGTGWGFLETFNLVPHVWAWWVFPVWAVGLGIGMIWNEITTRSGGEEP